MLQQTQVDRVLPKYHEWLEKYPSLRSARRRAARGCHQDVVPARLQHPSEAAAVDRARGGLEVRRRAAVGRSDAAVVQGHRRVHRRRDPQLCVSRARRDSRHQRRSRAAPRVSRRAATPNSTRCRRRLWQISAVLVPRRHVFDFNQALMDFGATVCIARKPRCLVCPMQSICSRLPVESRAGSEGAEGNEGREGNRRTRIGSSAE